ncbi:MAG: putative alpha/beta superfamily hydrolase [Flavobacteriales bacterium]|jgi:predicted alpha/beta superfamily hydrolase
MLNKFSIRSIGLLLLLSSLWAEAKQPLYFGHTETILSTALNEERILSVKLPQGYEDDIKASYPVFYTLDGQTHFRRVAGTLEWLSDTSQTIPKHIVVGIHSEHPHRMRDSQVIAKDEDTPPTADAFLTFLSDELIPYIDKTYRTAPHKILAGHSAYARFALYAYGQERSPFDAYILMSPAVPESNEDLIRFTLAQAKKMKSKQASDSFLFMALGYEPDLQSNVDILHKALSKNSKNNSAWEVQSYPKENHMSLPSKTLHNAMRSIAESQGWAVPTNVTRKNAKAIVKHYKNLSKKLGKTVEPNPMVFVNVAWEGINGADFDRAEDMLNTALKLYPEDAWLYNHLASSYEFSKQLKKAEETQIIAIALAKKQKETDWLKRF